MVRKIKSKNKIKNNSLLEEKKKLQKEIDEIQARQEENRKKLGISLEEEKKMVEYVEQNRGKGVSDQVLFGRIYRLILAERKREQKEKERKIKAEERQKEREKIKLKALEQIPKKDKKKKLSDNKKSSFIFRITDKEKDIIGVLKSRGVDITKELRKALYKIDRELTKEILKEDIDQAKKSLKEINGAISEIEKELGSLREIKSPSDNILIEMKKNSYLLSELKRDKKRTEKYLNELRELIK